MQSQVFQGALLPVYGQINKAFEMAYSGGEFSIGLFKQGIGGIGSLLETSFSDLKPVFNEIASLGTMLRDAFVGSFQHGTEYVPKTGLALVHEGETITPADRGGGNTYILNVGVVTTDYVDRWFAGRMDQMQRGRYGGTYIQQRLTGAGVEI